MNKTTIKAGERAQCQNCGHDQDGENPTHCLSCGWPLSGAVKERTQHTPGPWKVMNPAGEGDWAVLSDKVNTGGNFYVATLPNGSHAQAEANARLIAAAPELLDALQSVREAYQQMFQEMPVAFQTFDSICESAIAKVEGRAE